MALIGDLLEAISFDDGYSVDGKKVVVVWSTIEQLCPTIKKQWQLSSPT
jgi:hypothetical protein